MRSKERLNKAKQMLFDCTPAETILEYHFTPEYVEFIATAGGDALRYRVHDDGRIFAK